MKINRRDFIKTGGMVMLGSLAVPSFLGSCTGNKVDQATGISFAQNHFGVSENDMKKVLAAALEKGGDYADLFFEHSPEQYRIARRSRKPCFVQYRFRYGSTCIGR